MPQKPIPGEYLILSKHEKDFLHSSLRPRTEDQDGEVTYEYRIQPNGTPNFSNF